MASYTEAMLRSQVRLPRGTFLAGRSRNGGAASAPLRRCEGTVDAAAVAPVAALQAYAQAGRRRVPGVAPHVAIVGAGLAGLNAAWWLQNAGCRVDIFDASTRLGGRVRSDTGTLAPGQVVELGGEFIDQSHADMLALAAHFDLPLIDTWSGSESDLEMTWFFEGRRRADAQVEAAFAPFARRIASDAARLSAVVRHDLQTPDDIAFDRLSTAQYLDGLGVSGWLRQLLDVAFVTEFGVPTHAQSALNFLGTIGTDPASGFAVFGDSDQRYKIAGGNARMVDALAADLARSPLLDHRLVRVEHAGARIRLQFDRVSAPTAAVEADFVVLALPFSLLRQVDTGDVFPAWKRAAIDALDYGTNAKLIVGTDGRPWRDGGNDGDFFCDLPGQSGWDASRLRPGDAGALTFYLGGVDGVTCGGGPEQALADRFCESAEVFFGGLREARTGRVLRVHWPSEPFALGSYANHAPGYLSTHGGRGAQPVGNIHFAGEHCSAEFQGYMNGAAQTGRLSALAILERLGAGGADPLTA